MKHAKEGIRKAVEETAKKVGNEKGPNFSQMTSQGAKGFRSIKDVLGLADDSAENIYSQAYLLYNTGRYKDASEIFRLLVMLNSLEPKYLMGLAACFHMMKEYQTASSTYTLVSVLDPENPVPFFHASDCYLQIGDKPGACVMLEMALKRAASKPEFATLKQRAEITLAGLKKELAKNDTK